MAMTEQEAREKWCPQARKGVVYTLEPCLGSECMMWRWNSRIRYVPTSFGPAPVQEDLPRDKWTGYCGLGGKL